MQSEHPLLDIWSEYSATENPATLRRALTERLAAFDHLSLVSGEAFERLMRQQLTSGGLNARLKFSDVRGWLTAYSSNNPSVAPDITDTKSSGSERFELFIAHLRQAIWLSIAEPLKFAYANHGLPAKGIV